MIRSISFSSYSPVGDLNVIALCFLMIDLVFFSYINKPDPSASSCPSSGCCLRRRTRT